MIFIVVLALGQEGTIHCNLRYYGGTASRISFSKRGYW